MDYFGGQQPGMMYGGVQPGGMQMQQPPVQPMRRKNMLSQEEINALRANISNFTLGLTQEEINRSKCNHFDNNGELMLREVANEPGIYQCLICGYKMQPKDGLTKEQLEDCITAVEDVLQTVKLMYVDAPEQALSDYMTIIALLRKLPQLYKIAADNQAKYDPAMAQNYNGNLSAFAVFNNILNGTIAPPQGYMNQPVYQQPYPNQQYYNMGMQQPQQMAMPTPQQAAMLNPSTPYMPNTTGYSYTPGQETANANSANEAEQLRREVNELKAQLAATSGDNVTVTAKMES